MSKLTKQEQQQYNKCLGQCTQCMISANCTLRIKIKEIVSVDIIASGYEWTCPECNRLNLEVEITKYVECKDCTRTFGTNPPEHALRR